MFGCFFYGYKYKYKYEVVIKMENKDEYFATRDFYLACLLKAKDIKLVRAVKQNRITTFHFENKDNLDELIRNFYNDVEMISANKFIGAIRTLKAYTYNIR